MKPAKFAILEWAVDKAAEWRGGMMPEEWPEFDALIEEARRALSELKTQTAYDLLSKREREVFVRIGAGLAPAVIAEELKIASKSVYTYRARVLEKLGLKTNAEISVLAFELGLVRSVKQRYEGEKDERITTSSAGSSEQG